MTNYREGSTVFTKSQVGALNEARDVLRALEKDAQERCYATSRTHEAFNLGKLAETLDAAEGAIFNVLNVASSHVGIALTYEQIHNRAKGDD